MTKNGSMIHTWDQPLMPTLPISQLIICLKSSCENATNNDNQAPKNELIMIPVKIIVSFASERWTSLVKAITKSKVANPLKIDTNGKVNVPKNER